MRSLGALVFDGFETLDLFGPLEMFGSLPEEFKITIVGEHAGLVSSAHGQKIAVDQTLDQGTDFDLILVPGGPGTPIEVINPVINAWLKRMAAKQCLIMSVCTGSVLLARAGLLDERPATTNKMNYQWALPYGPKVKWVPKARWVEDGNIFTSSGVSAGMDMSLAVIERLLGASAASTVTAIAEYEWHSDPQWDPFADLYGV